jgi:HD superfamily phosphodiesterase
MGEEMMYEPVRREMERFFGEDTRRVAHALEVAEHALSIQAVEGGDRNIVTMASLLHDVGIKPAEERHGSSVGHLQEKLGPPVAEEILGKLGVEATKIATVKELIAHHHTPGKITTREFACLWDADFIVNLREVAPKMEAEKLRSLIEGKFMTKEGGRIARELFLPPSP